MAKYRVTSPDGGTFEITAPDGASEADVLAYAQKSFSSAKMPKVDPTEGGSTFLAGMGNGIASGVRALGGGSLLEKFGLPGTKDEADRLNKPLDATTGGSIGKAAGFATLAAPTALIPGANTYLGATAIGGLTGAALTDGGVADRAQGAAFGAAGGATGKALGDAVGAGARWALDKRAASQSAAQVANAQKDAAVQLARGEGYVIPPADVRGGFWNETLNGMSGKIKTAQVASQRNQQVTNDLIRKEFGLAPTDPLNAQTLGAIRQQAGKAYDAVENVGTITPGKNYTDALDAIVQPYTRAAKSFPNAKPNPIVSEIDTLRTTSFDAADAVAKIRTLRADADAAYGAGNKELGKSLKAGADALESAIEDHLAAAGPSPLLNAFREARKTIAKTYSVQKGLNDTTGDVAATALAKQLEKGRPLSGNLQTIAQVAQAFPKATQALKEAPKAVSPLDVAVGALSGASTGNPLALGMIAARPAARGLVLSAPYQNRMLLNNYGPKLTDSLLSTLESDMTRRYLIPPAVMGGLLTSN